MRSLLACLAVFALVFSVGCGGGDKTTDGCGDGCGDVTTPADTPTKTDLPAKPGSTAKDITYNCDCGKEKIAPADKPAPS
jgi:hypothetical protein